MIVVKRLVTMKLRINLDCLGYYFNQIYSMIKRMFTRSNEMSLYFNETKKVIESLRADRHRLLEVNKQLTEEIATFNPDSDLFSKVEDLKQKLADSEAHRKELENAVSEESADHIQWSEYISTVQSQEFPGDSGNLAPLDPSTPAPQDDSTSSQQSAGPTVFTMPPIPPTIAVSSASLVSQSINDHLVNKPDVVDHTLTGDTSTPSQATSESSAEPTQVQ